MQKIFFSLVLLVSISGYSQDYKIGFYNVENLFDTINDPTKDDEEFLPGSANDWNGKRYMEKISHINQVLGEMGNVLALGMCEIENANVIRDVIRYSPVMSKTHGIVHYESPDERGIDVGLIYDSIRLRLVGSGSIRFTLPGMEKPSSRDILWAKFVTKNKKDTIHIMVNHWPSRRGGEDKSDPNRVEAARNARNYIDSVLLINPQAKILFMGDLNDYPANNGPMAVAEKLKPQIVKESGEFGGSYSYNGQWDVLDHMMVSPALLGKKGLRVIPGSGKIYSPAYLMSEYKGNKVPFRTYAKNYLGGYSDHLPVSVGVKIK